MGGKLRLALILISASVFLFSGWNLARTLLSYREGADSYSDLAQYVTYEIPPAPPATLPPAPESTLSAPGVTEPAPEILHWPRVDFEALARINPDVVGWICIEGTNINYPIVQGLDNDHYLTHLFDGTQNRVGSIFLDYRCAQDFTDRHSIIYGHHLRDRTMFTGLMNYKDQTFYDEHSVILLVTPDARFKLRVFCGYVADNEANAWDLDLDDASHAAWLDRIQRKSYFRSDYTPTPDDAIITLSTCTYEFDDAKFVLHAYVEERTGTK